MPGPENINTTPDSSISVLNPVRRELPDCARSLACRLIGRKFDELTDAENAEVDEMMGADMGDDDEIETPWLLGTTTLTCWRDDCSSFYQVAVNNDGRIEQADLQFTDESEPCTK